MRASLLLSLAATLATAACVPEQHPEPEWMKHPKAYDIQGADLTFNKERLEAFNFLDSDEQEKHIEALKAAKGEFRGMAVFKSGAGLGAALEDAKYGDWELSASTDPVAYEITITYEIFTTKEKGKPLAPNRAIEFTGTLVDFDFQNESKPRSITIKVVADDVKPVED